MLSSVYGSLPVLTALAGTMAAVAALLHVALRRRERRRPEAVTLRPAITGRRCPDRDYLWSISHRARGSQRTESHGASPAARATPQGRSAGTGRFADIEDYDLTYLDAIDRAGALSFPASDPPAYSGPA